MIFSLIVTIHVLIFFSWSMGLNFVSWVESRHVRLLSKLGRARQTTRWFNEVPLIAFQLMFYHELSFFHFR